MKLNILEDERRFIVDSTRLDAPLHLPAQIFGDIDPVELRLFRKTARGLIAVDLSSYQVTLLLGESNERPTLGFWQLTTTGGTSAPIAARANAQDTADAIGDVFGGCTVTGGNGSYVVTVDAAGVWTLPTGTFFGNTLSGVLVFEITPGTATTSAQYRIEVLQVGPARIIPADWTPADTTPVNSFTQVDGKLWQLLLDPRADSGFFTLTIDAITTGYISVLAGAYDIAVALSTAGKPASVQADNMGGFYVSFTSTVTAASVQGQVTILPYLIGALDLTGSGVRELLDGLQFTTAKICAVLVKDGETVTAASADVLLYMPVNAPSTLTIDAPQMAGLTFAVSTDGAYLHIYQNGAIVADALLNSPT